MYNTKQNILFPGCFPVHGLPGANSLLERIEAAQTRRGI
jgi:hypothetical protein